LKDKVLELFGLSRDDLYSRGRHKNRAGAKALLSFWAVRERGVSQTQLAELLGMTQPGVAVAVARGERLIKKKGYVLLADAEQS
jgi:putative transposase